MYTRDTEQIEEMPASQENGGCLRRYVADLAVVEIWSNQNYSEPKGVR